MNFFIVTTLLSYSFHTTVSSASIPFHSTTIFTLAYLLPLSLAHLPQQKTPFKLAILYNKSIAGAHPSFLLEEAILLTLIFKTPGPLLINDGIAFSSDIAAHPQKAGSPQS